MAGVGKLPELLLLRHYINPLFIEVGLKRPAFFLLEKECTILFSRLDASPALSSENHLSIGALILRKPWLLKKSAGDSAPNVSVYALTYYLDIPREMYGLMRLTLKYLLMGGASSSILVHGFSWLYGSSGGEIELQEIVNGLINTQMYNSPGISINCFIFIIVGIGFKLSPQLLLINGLPFDDKGVRFVR
ncbi:hypothetical protein IFM89_012901 [Coptis chinensis]|uniref:NADH:quinone oxidoreductase/Mrp antiporter transmembrane domain-containing protein n=1 Tax=Coptis chinensis TaxID=261450 RepID=A0A835HEB3_9MAGN|nr:hypothetical protein IFM89_012901 [Coptis chinensis]